MVATPIGNMADISARARDTLASADVVASEDTRRTGLLLQRLGLHKPQVSFHMFNEDRSGARLAGMLRAGRDVALVSDAGTPGIADPGYSLIRRAIDDGVPVTVVPGPCALIAALAISGLPAHAFTFRGFPPRTAGARERFLRQDAEVAHTLIYYESPHRLGRLLAAAAAVFGERQAAVCVELTKKFEEVRRGGLAELAAAYADTVPRGEATLVVHGLGRGSPGGRPRPSAGGACRTRSRRVPKTAAASPDRAL